MSLCFRVLPRFLLLLLALSLLGSSGGCTPDEVLSPFFHFVTPKTRQLSEVGTLDVALRLPPLIHARRLRVRLVSPSGSSSRVSVSRYRRNHRRLAVGQLNAPAPGWYALEATAELRFFIFRVPLRAATHFETVQLDRADICEVMNDANCLLPYPSSRFLREDPDSPTGVRVALPAEAMPHVIGDPIDPMPYMALDGFSPTVQILMHFPGGVDVAGSGASRLLPAGVVPVSPPYIDTRTQDGRSLEADSPTLLIRARTGERVLHFVELDAHAQGNPAHQALIMRPGESLVPGERYIVAVRHLVHPDGSAVRPEAPFAALRDRRPTTVGSLAARRPRFEREIFRPLHRAGVSRDDLILAFDFTVQSDEGLTAEMLSMRDQGFDWLDRRLALGEQTFDVDSVEQNDCSLPGTTTWRIVRGHFEVPLFLSSDPELAILVPGTLMHGADGRPAMAGLTRPPFTLSLPCSVLDPSAVPPHPVLLGHGLFGRGEDMVTSFASSLGLDYIAGATNWRGLSGGFDGDLAFVALSVIGIGSSQLNNVPALPDRLRQGQLNTLLLARMMKIGAFDVDPAFRTPDDRGALPGVDSEMFYYGISLGGIMGTMFSALTPDVERLQIDVPAMNFSFLLQRSTQFDSFELALTGIGLDDPMDVLLGLGLIHEFWVKGEPAGYARHVTGLVDAPLPGTNAKRMLMTVAWLDKQVSNQASEVLARTLGIPNLDASIQQGLQGIDDRSGPLPSALVIWDVGSFDLFDPAHAPFIPPLANLIPSDKCDPHARRLLIPAAQEQMLRFLRPGGLVENTCDGLCDAAIAFEHPGGTIAVCDPLL